GNNALLLHVVDMTPPTKEVRVGAKLDVGTTQTGLRRLHFDWIFEERLEKVVGTIEGKAAQI
ncbi:hypothetical protein, partial [Klebsiella pneumoniae]